MTTTATTYYTATIELHAKATQARLQETANALDDFQAVVGSSQRGRLQVTISLPAEGLRQAGALALALVESAAGADAATLEVMSSAEHESRVGAPAVDLPELVSVTEAADMLGVTRQAVLQMIERERMPARRAGSTWVMALSSVEQLL